MTASSLLGIASCYYYFVTLFSKILTWFWCLNDFIVSLQLAVTRSTWEGEDKAFDPTTKRSGRRRRNAHHQQGVTDLRHPVKIFCENVFISKYSPLAQLCNHALVIFCTQHVLEKTSKQLLKSNNFYICPFL